MTSRENKLYFLSVAAGIVSLLGLWIATKTDNVELANGALIAATVFIIPLCVMYTLLIFRRITPTKFVFFSCADMQDDIVLEIKRMLDEKLNFSSRYKYKIITRDDVPLGSDMKSGIKSLVEKSEVIILFATDSYLKNEWCLFEFESFDFEKQRIIPITYVNTSILSKMPKDISNVKGLSYGGGFKNREEELKELVTTLARDIKKNRK